MAVMSTLSSVKWLLTRRVPRVDRKLISAYMSQHEIRKLHIGCGDHLLDGWLNADYHPVSPKVLHLDATRRFPLGDKVIDYVFSEHMIEHIEYRQGMHMLRECYRILKPDGKIRVTTPDLAFLIALYAKERSDLQSAYIKWSTDRFIGGPSNQATFVINNFVRNWGHQFIYDEQILRASLETAGFARVVVRELGKSDHGAFCNLENEERLPRGFLRLESIVLEGTKE
jgi:predicted SAM-dependent methyltransferase